jgi:hypothetical protein
MDGVLLSMITSLDEAKALPGEAHRLLENKLFGKNTHQTRTET